MKKVEQDSEKYIFVDLWETVLIEKQNSNNLDINYDRGEIIYKTIEKYNNVEFWKNRIEQEIKEFKEQENKGHSIKPLQRIKRIINEEGISDEEYLRILNEFDQLILNKYMPKVNLYLINKLKNQKNIILISNTGLTTKHCVIQILKEYKIYDMFKDMFFSEDYEYCKPNEKFFKIPIEKYNIELKNILMIGDSIEKDYTPCKKLGIKCIIRDWRKINIKENE